MGVANYYIKDAESVYIYKEDVYGEECWDDDSGFYVDLEFDNLVSMILESLPCSFEETECCWLDRERQLIAQSGMYLVSIAECESYFSLNIEIIDDIQCSSLAKYRLHTTAKRIFDKLNQIYNLYERDTAWTSSKRIPEQPKNAA